MFSKLGEVEERFIDLEREMMQPEIAADPKRYRSTAKQAAELRPLVTTYREYKQIEAELMEYQELIQGDDEELKSLAQEVVMKQPCLLLICFACTVAMLISAGGRLKF